MTIHHIIFLLFITEIPVFSYLLFGTDGLLASSLVLGVLSLLTFFADPKP